MRIRVVRARSMADAMRLLAAELGPEAVLLASRRVGEGYEVTGGVEPEPPDGPPEEPLPKEFLEEPLMPAFSPAQAPLPESFALPLPALSTAGPPLRGGAAEEAAAALAFHGVPGALRDRLLSGPLEAMLAATLRFGRLPPPEERPLLLAGPPGAGKTLTTVKLAARQVLSGATPPLIVDTDQQRPGAAAQLVGVAALLRAPLSHAASPAAALQAVALRPPGGVLIDTPGTDPFDPEQARALLALIQATRAHVALVLPAGLDSAEAADLARAFRALGATHMIPTRLDATRRMGGLLSAAAAASLVIAEAGAGNRLADGLLPLSPAWMAERLRRRTHAGPPGSTAAHQPAATAARNALFRAPATLPAGDFA
ncbi:flagellar biosynthesis protein FlhF [Teichococcus aestuarii]|uniref:SRP54-type proteins GTP-binding domain-containing protein n=1 Tax=Teichococcus aestuarii TaxID=568898 RepID=A0A2U1V2X5_9PROT|nr:hypothetical protein [Pseudoroseomonas aestuarii]PWC28246.1 hypothetical protein CR165_13195 [Pseudoroseomonas aestuarii]